MKDERNTLREWTLTRHQPPVAALDRIRAEALRRLPSAGTPNARMSGREALAALFAPNQALWRALGVAWLIIAALHITTARSKAPSAPIPPASLAALGTFSDDLFTSFDPHP